MELQDIQSYEKVSLNQKLELKKYLNDIGNWSREDLEKNFLDLLGYFFYYKNTNTELVKGMLFSNFPASKTSEHTSLPSPCDSSPGG